MIYGAKFSRFNSTDRVKVPPCQSPTRSPHHKGSHGHQLLRLGSRVGVLSRFSRLQLFVTPWTVACQTPLSIGLSRQKYWSGLLRPPPGDLPHPGIKPTSLMPPALAGGFFTTSSTWEAPTLTFGRTVSAYSENVCGSSQDTREAGRSEGPHLDHI